MHRAAPEKVTESAVPHGPQGLYNRQLRDDRVGNRGSVQKCLRQVNRWPLHG